MAVMEKNIQINDIGFLTTNDKNPNTIIPKYIAIGCAQLPFTGLMKF